MIYRVFMNIAHGLVENATIFVRSLAGLIRSFITIDLTLGSAVSKMLLHKLEWPRLTVWLVTLTATLTTFVVALIRVTWSIILLASSLRYVPYISSHVISCNRTHNEETVADGIN